LLVNRTRESATLFNDRYGLHRLYWHQAPDAFYFAAEAKAILAVCPDVRAVDERGLAEYVSCGCVLENRTLFKGINLLPPGSAWVCRDGKVARRSAYFDPAEWEQQPRLGPEEYYEELRSAFSRNLPLYFSGSQRVAISLTGGFDTRMIMAWHKAPPGTLPCYTFGGASRESHDVLVGRRVAAATDQPHAIIRVGPDFLARFAHYAERTVYLTDGCADVSRSADLYVNEIARTVAPVRMTGNYGSEVLRRVRAFKPIDLAAGLFTPELLAHLPAARDTYASLLRGHPLSFAVFRQAPWHHYGLLKLEESQLSVRTPYLDNDFVRTVFRAPESALTGYGVCARLIADGNPALLDIETDRAVRPRPNTTSTLGRAVREFSFKAEYAYDYGMPQWLARINHALSPLRLERLFMGRHKFYHYRVWYRDALSPYVRDMLLDSKALSRPYVQPAVVQAIVSGHVRGDRNFTLEIHRLLTLELFHRLFIDQAVAAHRPTDRLPVYAS
jgi:asparagine synthase (glutamine-hydrolysing)